MTFQPPYSHKTRKRAYDLLDSGMTVQEVACELGVHNSTIQSWRNARCHCSPMSQPVPSPTPLKSGPDAVQGEKIELGPGLVIYFLSTGATEAEVIVVKDDKPVAMVKHVAGTWTHLL